MGDTVTVDNDLEMQVVVRTGLSLLTARKHHDEEHHEHQGLALILLDGATESLLRQIVENQEIWFRLGELMAHQNSQAAAQGLGQPHVVDSMTFPSEAQSAGGPVPVHLSNKQRQKLHAYFDPNVDVAVFFGYLSVDEGKALKHLHKYRNGAHHGNVINIRTVKALVELQLTVVASLLFSMPASGLTRIYPPIDYGPMRAVLGLPDGVGVTYRSFADILKEGIDLTAREVSETLGRNLSERLALVKRRITRISDDMNVPGVSLDDWTALIQTRQPWPTGAAAIRALSPPVTMSKLTSWENRVVAHAPGETALHAFARFVDVDLPLSKLEDEVQAIEDQVDREIQALIDARRGK